MTSNYKKTWILLTSDERKSQDFLISRGPLIFRVQQFHNSLFIKETKSYLFSTHPVESHTFLPCVYDVCMLFSALVSPNLILLFHFELFHNPNRPAVRPVLFGRRARALDFDSARPHVRKARAEFLPILKGFFIKTQKF